MYARVTQLEIDTVRVDLESALELFRQNVLPDLREQEGYEGVIVCTTPEGRGLLVSLWATEEDAEAGGEAGFYPEALAKFMIFFRSPPGRERYEVVFAEAPTLLVG